MLGYILITIVFVAGVVVGGFGFLFFKKMHRGSKRVEADTKNKMYELAILKEISDRIGYSLNVKNIADVIVGSLHQFIDYSTVSYMLLEPEKIIFNAHLEKPVSHKFIDDVKERMLDSLTALLNVDFKNARIEEVMSGVISSDESADPVKSVFDIPLVVAGKVVGMLNVADTKAGLYKEEEMAILYKITQQASLALTRLQEVVQTEQSKMNAMVQSMADGVVMTDLDYKILVVNPAAKKATGLDYKEELSILDFVERLGDKFDFKDKIEGSVRDGKVFISEEISLINGFFQIVISPVKDNKNKILGGVIIFHDITKEKEVEKIKEDFTSMIVHELRTPLDANKKMIEMMRTSKIQKAKQMECFQMMYNSSSSMLQLINNLLDMAKIEAGKFDISKQPYDIKEVITECVSFFEVASKDAKVEITSEFDKNLPDKIEFDPHAISQVLNNFVSNALKFNKENGRIIIQALMHKSGKSLADEAGEAKINLFLKNDFTNTPDSLFVMVVNDGQGIPKEQIGQLFNKFMQVKSNFSKKAGTGLGLAIVKSIIESHGGNVGVESAENEQTIFYFTIPI